MSKNQQEFNMRKSNLLFNGIIKELDLILLNEKSVRNGDLVWAVNKNNYDSYIGIINSNYIVSIDSDKEVKVGVTIDFEKYKVYYLRHVDGDWRQDDLIIQKISSILGEVIPKEGKIIFQHAYKEEDINSDDLYLIDKGTYFEVVYARFLDNGSFHSQYPSKDLGIDIKQNTNIRLVGFDSSQIWDTLPDE